VRQFRQYLLAAGAALTLGLTAQSAAADQIFGSAAIITNRPCTAPEGQICDVSVPRNFTQTTGGYGVAVDSFAQTPEGGFGEARVSFGDGYLPTIGLGSLAGDTSRTGASLTAFRSFTYTGDVAIDLALNGQLHYVTSGDLVFGDGFGEGTLNAAFAVMPLSDFAAYGPQMAAIDIINNVNNTFPDCGGGAIAVGGYNSLGVGAGTYLGTLGLSQACGGGAITLNPGDSFVIVASLQAISNRGGSLDAMHTFTVQYDTEHTYLAGTTDRVDPSVFASIDGAVPEPAAWAMMIMGFAGVGAVLRRRSGAPAPAGRSTPC
jgi:hypothetical protein